MAIVVALSSSSPIHRCDSVCRHLFGRGRLRRSVVVVAVVVTLLPPPLWLWSSSSCRRHGCRVAVVVALSSSSPLSLSPGGCRRVVFIAVALAIVIMDHGVEVAAFGHDGVGESIRGRRSRCGG